jgi:hypothetical protein
MTENRPRRIIQERIRSETSTKDVPATWLFGKGETMKPNEDPTTVELGEGEHGQILAGLDDMLVLLRRRARSWFGEDAPFLEKFDHVVQEIYSMVKWQSEKSDDPDADSMVDEGDPNTD